jgi:signal transduction histidine kinase
VAAVRLSVSDTGPGIREEDMALLFTPFRQIDSTLARKHEGTGLGLAISQRMVELMGGRIEARSTWGQGCTFTVTLPVEPMPMQEST